MVEFKSQPIRLLFVRMSPMSTNVSSLDTTYRKVFVGGLPYHTSDQSLREFFNTFGDIEEAVVIHDRATGKSKGYGFVTMQDADAASKAVANPTPIIDGRKANVNLAYLGAKPRPKIVPGVIGLRPLTAGSLIHPQYATATALTPQYLAAYQNYCQALAAHQHALLSLTSPASQGQPAAAQTFFETNPYYAAAAAAHVQYQAPTSPDYTTSATSAAQLAAGIGNQSSNVTAAFLAQQQQLQNSGFMQVATAANQFPGHATHYATYPNESQ